jgi:hypothetical protein
VCQLSWCWNCCFVVDWPGSSGVYEAASKRHRGAFARSIYPIGCLPTRYHAAAAWRTTTPIPTFFDQLAAGLAPRFSVASERSCTTNTVAEDLNAQTTLVRRDGVRNYLDLLTLDAHLTTLLDTARLERAHGVPAGAPVYSLLHRQATEQVRNYCSCWRLDPSLVEAEIPSLGELHRFTVRAMPVATVRRGGWLLTLGLAALAISVALSSD